MRSAASTREISNHASQAAVLQPPKPVTPTRGSDGRQRAAIGALQPYGAVTVPVRSGTLFRCVGVAAPDGRSEVGSR